MSKEIKYDLLSRRWGRWCLRGLVWAMAWNLEPKEAETISRQILGISKVSTQGKQSGNSCQNQMEQNKEDEPILKAKSVESKSR